MSYQPGAFVVFRYAGDLPRTGTVVEDNSCGLIVEGYADARKYMCDPAWVRLEFSHERFAREETGYLKEDRP